jgi:hypothetical protein
MGDRGMIKVVNRYCDGAVYLYTHWRGGELEETLASALKRARSANWLEDASFLARIIFCEMLGDDPSIINDTSGFGIASRIQTNLQNDLLVVHTSPPPRIERWDETGFKRLEDISIDRFIARVEATRDY